MVFWAGGWVHKRSMLGREGVGGMENVKSEEKTQKELFIGANEGINNI